MKQPDVDRFLGLGAGSVEGAAGLQLQGGYYRGEEMPAMQRLGVYGGLGVNFESEGDYSYDFGPGTFGDPRVGERTSAVWGSLGGTYRVAKLLGIRVGLCVVGTTAYGEYDDPTNILTGGTNGVYTLEEDSGTTAGVEFGFDLISDKDLAAGAVYSAALDGLLVNISWVL